jgi:predicted N-acetyltransferase YhbS
MIIRQEIPEDIRDIHALNEQAFGAPEEANIIDKLRDNCEGLLSLVAIEMEKKGFIRLMRRLSYAD